MAVNAIQNGGLEVFFADRFYSEENELYKFISKTPEYKDAQAIVRHWMKSQEK